MFSTALRQGNEDKRAGIEVERGQASTAAADRRALREAGVDEFGKKKK